MDNGPERTAVEELLDRIYPKDGFSRDEAVISTNSVSRLQKPD